MLHRLLIQVPKGYVIDHINRDKLDNRRSNLRIGKQSDNLRNARKKKGSSKYKGVSWHSQMCKWAAYITVNYKTKYLGMYLTEEEAALAYNKAAIEANKEFSLLNDVTGGK